MSKRPTDDLEPSAKRGKRGSDRQLTKDDPDEEDDQPVAAGTFARATDDELKGRRIIKARRGPKNETTSANPFAGVNLTSSSTNPFAGVSLTGSQPALASAVQAQSSPAETAVPSTASDAHLAQQQPANGSSGALPKSAASPQKSPGAEAAAATPASTPVKPAAAAPSGFSSFASNTASGFAVTASSASGFAFGSASAPAVASSSDPASSSGPAAATTATAPQPAGSIFGFPQPAGSFSFATLPAAGTSTFPSMQSIFGTSSASEAPHVFGSGSTSTKPAVELSEADTKNGEEDEETSFHGDGKLFQFVDQQWRERGSGDMRLKVNPSGQARLVMRQRGNLKLLLNANLFPGMTHSVMDGGKGAMFQALNFVSPKEEAPESEKQPAGESGLTTFAFKSKQPGVVAAFEDAVKSHKVASKAKGKS